MRFATLHSEGALLPLDIVEKASRGELEGQRPADFGLSRGRRLTEEISAVWASARDHWTGFRRRVNSLPESDPATSVTREQWMTPLLGLLDHRLTYQASAAVLGGRTYHVSHRSGEGSSSLPVHIEGFRTELDRRSPGARLRMSPQALLQEYLNRTEVLWGIVTNGRRLRLLRQTPRVGRPSYVEFDLEAMMEAGHFAEFAILYRLCHRSRLPRDGEDPASCLLEKYYQEGIEQGGRVRDRLRDGVEEALETLGTAFLRHPKNDGLRRKVAKPGSATDLYRQLLRLVYRILFLMVIEERGMVFPDGDNVDRRQRAYEECYSVSRLRRLAERRVGPGSFCDIWEGLKVTFSLLENGHGENPLGVPPLNGDLFGPGAIPDLQTALVCNGDLVRAIRCLSLFPERGILTRVNYSALDVEELGSVYESLLDYHPAVISSTRGLAFELLGGSERKSTGSYYTPRPIVAELVESALVPVMEERLAGAETRDQKEQALLEMTVCDPASGSGHFLLAAARRLGRELARVRSGEDEPTPEQFREAVRDVIAHCIYAVDLNPLAVDLCKLALWIEGHNSGKPLSFLDNRIRCGNSLIGLSALSQLEEGIPDQAFTPVFGDDGGAVREARRSNAVDREKARRLGAAPGERIPSLLAWRFGGGRAADQDRPTSGWEELASLRDDTIVDIKRKERLYAQLRGEGTTWWRDWVAAHLWTAAFFVPIRAVQDAIVTGDVVAVLAGGEARTGKAEIALQISEKNTFLHWPLEFPEVLSRGGFDVILGNPPWERIKLQEQEFFALRDPRIAQAVNKAERQTLIARLKDENPGLWEEFTEAKRLSEAQSKFLRQSGRFPLAGRGDVNIYGVFAELGRLLLRKGGRAGMVIPTGIATDYTYRDFFADLVRRQHVASLFDLENRKGIFPAVDSRQRFALLTMTTRTQAQTDLAFYLLDTDQIKDDLRRMRLSLRDLELFNPNTLTCPIFRTRQDMELTRKIYERVPVLVNERTGKNPWGVEFMAMFHMSNDSGLFQTRSLLEGGRYRLEGNRFVKSGEVLLPLYEAKMMHQFDHRWGTYHGRDIRDVTNHEKAGPDFVPLPRYWVAADEVEKRLEHLWGRGWMLAFRDIARATDERTAIFTILPRVGAGHPAPLVFPAAAATAKLVVCLCASLDSLAFDYVARQKVAGTHMTYFYLKQIPVLPPQTYSGTVASFIVPRAAELIYTAWDMRSFAEELGHDGPPFAWDEDRRAELRAELDAYFAHLYGLTRDELLYVLDPQAVYGQDFPGETFRVLKESELRVYGEYRTARLVLEAWDRLSASGWNDPK